MSEPARILAGGPPRDLNAGPLSPDVAGDFDPRHWAIHHGGGVRVWTLASEGVLDDAWDGPFTPQVSKTINGELYHELPSGLWIAGPPPAMNTFLVEGHLSNTTSVWFTFRGEYIEDETQDPFVFSITRSEPLIVAHLDLDIDSDNDGEIDLLDDGIEEDPPGKFLVIDDVGPSVLTPIRTVMGPANLMQQWTLTYPEERITVWETPSRTTQIPSGAAQLQALPAELYVEPVGPSAQPADVSIVLHVTLPGQTVGSDTVAATSLDAQLTVYRPTTPPFAVTPVPDAAEAGDGGAGIRYNGDDDNDNNVADDTEAPVAGEDDLIRVSITGQSIFALPATHEWALRRGNGAVRAWLTPDKQFQEVFGANNTGAVDFTDHFLEWSNPALTAANLELGVREIATGRFIRTDVVSLYRFQSVVIALGGEDQVPADPPSEPNNHGTFQVAIALCQNGYNVYMFDEDVVSNNGSGLAYNTVANAVANQAISNVAIYGYSHGGGSTFDLANRITAFLAPSIPFTSYVDAVANGSDQDVQQELRFPPGSAFHLNHYQHGTIGDCWLDGGPVPGSNPPPTGLDVETTPWGAGAKHGTIDDFVQVRNAIVNQLTTRVIR